MRPFRREKEMKSSGEMFEEQMATDVVSRPKKSGVDRIEAGRFGKNGCGKLDS
jgi:hypothetical protein